MLYLISLGLNEKGISQEGLQAVKKCRKLYIETYTSDFPYDIKKISKVIGKKPVELLREDIESDLLIKEAKKTNVGLLVYGCALSATTHISLLLDAKKARVKTKVIYSGSIFDAIAETGLQPYKFGKVTSMPTWKDEYKPDSFLDIVKENQSINAHSLILIDIGLKFKDAIAQLEQALKNKEMKVDKIVVCSNLGTDKKKIVYGKIKSLKNKKISNPFCFIILEKMHFFETEVLEKGGV